MKSLLVALILLVSTTANAALFITNNTGCDVDLEISAHDANLPGACSYYAWVEVAGGQAKAFNNVTDPQLSWRLTPIALVNYTTMTTAGAGWDAIRIGLMLNEPYVGEPGTCATGTIFTYNRTCDPTVTWTNLGGGNVLVTIN